MFWHQLNLCFAQEYIIKYKKGLGTNDLPRMICLIRFVEPPCWFNNVITRCFILKKKMAHRLNQKA